MSTPWISDRIKVKPKKGSNNNNSGRSNQQQQKAIPKSKAVLAIQATIDAFQSHPPTQKDEKGGCFCLARMHPLARPGARLCLSCGLILCNLNPPYAACPSCATPVLSPHARTEMIASLHSDLEKQLADEERQREEAERRVQATEGAFPTLPTAKPTPSRPPSQQQHKVLSLNSKTKKVMVQTRSAVPSPSPSPAPEPVEDEPMRIPPPTQPVAGKGVVQGRLWVNLSGDRAKYIAPPPTPGQKKGKQKQKAPNP